MMCLQRSFKLSMFFLMSLASVLLLIGCIPTNTRFNHYQPKGETFFNIEFDYPKEWELTVTKSGNSGMIGFDDTREKSTLSPDVDWEDEFILFHVSFVDENDFSVEKEVQSWVDDFEVSPFRTIIKNQAVEIDHYPARYITIKNEPNHAFGQFMPVIRKEVFLQIKDRYYRFSLQIPESKQDGYYARAFDEILNSIRVLP